MAPAKRFPTMDSPLFGFAPYHLLLAGCGLVIVAAYWLPRFVKGREPAASGLLIVGGHTIVDKEPKYGLAVVGLVRPDEVTTNAGARVMSL